jgi:uncharacterized membrane protein required for colicin V production
MKFSFIDVFLIAGLCLGAYLGYRGGLAKKMFNLLMLMASGVIAIRFMRTVGKFFMDAGVLSERPAFVLGFVIVALVIMIPALLLYHRFGKSREGQKSVTMAFGVILGLLEGAMITSFLLIGLRVLEVPDDDTRQESLLYRPLLRFVPKTFDMLQSYFPGASEFRKEIELRFKDIDLYQAPSPPRKVL